MGENLLLKIRSRYPSFTKIEKKIASYILEKVEEVIYCSITECAANCEVSETSVIRFCRHLGISGYQEFKLLLARETLDPNRNLHKGVGFSDNITSIIKSITEENLQAISDTMKVFSPIELERAAEAIIKAKRLEIYGVGASGFTAMDAMYKFKRIGKLAEAYTDPHIQSMSASLLTKEDVVLGISFTGSTKDTVGSLALAKKNNAITICITNHEKSPIIKHSDIVLLTSIRETPLQSGALTSKIAQIHVLDLLYIAVTVKIKEEAMMNINKTAGAVLNKLY